MIIKLTHLKSITSVAMVLTMIATVVWWGGRAHAATVGPNLPSTSSNNTTVGTSAWTGMTSLYATDSTYSTNTLAKNVIGNYLVGTGFGFALPSNAQIQGVQAVVNGYATTTSTHDTINDYSVKLVLAGAVSGTEHAAATVMPTVAGGSTSYGTTTDTWGLTMTGADVDAANFGLAVSWQNISTGPGGTDTANIDSYTITLTYIIPNIPPAAPTLSAPAASATAVKLAPAFTLRSTDANSDYLRYRIHLYASDCTTVVATYDETLSQTGWSGQDQQTATAYTGSPTLTSSTMATYTISTPLSAATTYCWTADAIDPGGTNTWSAISASRSFTTNAAPAAPTLSAPIGSISGVSLTPHFDLATTDADSDPVQYRIDLCGDSTCSAGTLIGTYDQSVTQAGWSRQNALTETAYLTAPAISGSTTARYGYTSFLQAGKQYWWRAQAMDVNGTGTWGLYSTIATFTTTTSTVEITGGVNVVGGTNTFGP